MACSLAQLVNRLHHSAYDDPQMQQRGHPLSMEYVQTSVDALLAHGFGDAKHKIVLGIPLYMCGICHTS
jgi:GH18 family chitinase